MSADARARLWRLVGVYNHVKDIDLSTVDCPVVAAEILTLLADDLQGLKEIKVIKCSGIDDAWLCELARRGCGANLEVVHVEGMLLSLF